MDQENVGCREASYLLASRKAIKEGSVMPTVIGGQHASTTASLCDLKGNSLVDSSDEAFGSGAGDTNLRA